MENKHIKRRSLTDTTREWQITTVAIRVATTQNTDQPKRWWGCGATRTLIYLLVRRKNGSPLEHSLAVSCKAKQRLTVRSSKCITKYFSKCGENVCPQKPARECWQHFIPKCPKTGSNQDVLPSQMDGGGPYSDKKMFLSSHKKTGRNLTCMLLSERSQWKRLRTVRFQPYNTLGKQNKETANTIMVARGWGGEG